MLSHAHACTISVSLFADVRTSGISTLRITLYIGLSVFLVVQGLLFFHVPDVTLRAGTKARPKVVDVSYCASCDSESVDEGTGDKLKNGTSESSLRAWMRAGTEDKMENICLILCSRT